MFLNQKEIIFFSRVRELLNKALKNKVNVHITLNSVLLRGVICVRDDDLYTILDTETQEYFKVFLCDIVGVSLESGENV